VFELPEPVFELPEESVEYLIAKAPTPSSAPMKPSMPQTLEEEFTLDLAALQVPPPAVVLPPILGGTITKPAKNGRPPLKITYLRRGEPSPLESDIKNEPRGSSG
jgi:hypothetical protein